MNLAGPAPNFSKKECLQDLVCKFHGEQVLFEQVSVVHIVINFQVRMETWQLKLHKLFLAHNRKLRWLNTKQHSLAQNNFCFLVPRSGKLAIYIIR